VKQSINLVLRYTPGGEYRTFQVFVLPVVAFILLFILILGSTSKAQKVTSLRKQVESLSQQREEINRSISKLAEFFPIQNQPSSGLNHGSFLGNPVEWSHILGELGKRLPSQVWLLQVESYTIEKKSSGGKEFRITGMANGHGDVERFIFSLEEPQLWKDIRLVYAQKVEVPPHVEFQLTARLK
jgi:Tfp pilus assembly protein PilN